MKKRVMVICPDYKDSTSFYRGFGPFFALEKRMPDVEFVFPKEKDMDYDWTVFARIDVLFLQRPSIPGHVAFIRMAKAHGVKIWIDHDDNLLEVPESNQAHKIHSDPHSRQALLMCMQLADVITVSTSALIPRDGSKFKVIPNAFNDFFVKPLDALPFQKDKVIMWRGTQTHQEDLLAVREDLESFHKNYPGWKFVFVGMRPWFLDIPYEHVPTTDLASYFEIIQIIQPKYQIVTLSNTPFNRCKSNIAWIEGTFAGAQVIAPGMPEWTKPGISNYANGNFLSVLSTTTNRSEKSRIEDRDMSWRYIQDGLFLSDVNQQRETILNELFYGNGESDAGPSRTNDC